MQDYSWLHTDTFKNIHPKKLEVMADLMKQTDGKPIAQSIPFLLKAKNELSKDGLSFTTEETAVIMEFMTRDMSPQEKEQLEKLKGMIQKQIQS